MEKVKQHKIFDEAYNAFARDIFRFIYFRVSDYQLAQDLTEDTFVRFWKQIHKGKKVAHTKALLYVIARGLIIDSYRKKKHTPIATDAIDEQFLAHIDTTEEELSMKQDLEQIYRHMKRLKKEYQEVLFLHYTEDLVISEIALILHKKENAVRVQLHRALKALKEEL